ncbi:MAG: 5'/3'-nucleotidase SurE [Deltaproteobacteria bacterium]|nr:MAG: 5'/3'-nucleotidase SurE [Deltaproteobacteria bacterium]
MKIVLTNDYGIDTPGLDALFQIFRTVSTPIIVAPEHPQSGISHRVTTRAPISVKQLGQNRFSVGGTPADCARIALKDIVTDACWLISGINPGANLGSDVYQSGTVAAAREAAILGCAAMSVSQYIAKDCQVDWAVTRKHAQPVLHMLLEKDTAPGCFWNVNLPHPLTADDGVDFEFCRLDTNPHKYRYRSEGNNYIYEGTIHERPRDPAKDVAVCFGGKISISKLAIQAAVKI